MWALLTVFIPLRCVTVRNNGARMRFNAPPNWPLPAGFMPPEGWQPPVQWGPAPHGWRFWLQDHPQVQAPQFHQGVAPYYGSALAIQTDQKTDTTITILAWILAFVTLFYMLPWAVAATRGKSNHGAICVVNLLLG